MQRLIIRLPNWIGDAIMATPLLDMLKKQYPKTYTIGCAPSHILELFKGLPFLDETVTISSRRESITAIRQVEADTALLLTGSFSSAYHVWRAQIPTRIGFSCHWRRILLTNALPQPKEGHDVEKYMQLLKGFDLIPPEKPGLLHLQLLQEEKEAFKQRLEQTGIYPSQKLIVINPGAAYGEAKCWPKEYFKKVIQELAAIPNLHIAITGNATQTQVANELAAKTPTIHSFAGKTTIRELMALIERADCVISNDSGPMHIAAAFKRPLIALFGSTDPKQTSPWGDGIVLYNKVSCSPCFRRTCNKDFRCMLSITPKMVLEAIYSQIGNKHVL